jgi:enamine deaminase RidA (YjgF/YER057c/UK114 family)
MRHNISSGGIFEDSFGYSRAVRVGNHVAVAGSCARGTALDGDAYVQAADAIRVIGRALEEAGASLEHVVRTVTYVINIADMPLITRAHSEAFDAIRPVSTLVEVSALADPRYLVEIQADAIIPDT